MAWTEESFGCSLSVFQLTVQPKCLQTGESATISPAIILVNPSSILLLLTHTMHPFVQM